MLGRALPVTILVLACAIMALTACSADDLDRTSWEPKQSPEGDELHIGVFVGGCDSFDTVEVHERDEDVSLQAYIKKDAKDSCDDILGVEEHTVSLGAPLSGRPLLGCNPDDSAYPLPGNPSNEECERLALYGR